MKKLLLFILLASSINAFSQIKIELGDMPMPADTPRYSIAEPSPSFLMSYKSTGANHTWNFDSLKSLQQDVEEYMLSSKTAYNFPGTIAKKYADTIQLGGMQFTNIFEFYDTTSTVFSLVGRGLTFGFPLNIRFPKADSVYQFPLEYLDRDSSIFQAKFVQPFLGVYYLSEGYRINEVDGYGQITTPFGTFDVIRVVTDIVQSDTVSFDTINNRINTHLREYKWLAKGIEYPILQVSGSVSAGTFFPINVTFRDSIHPSSPVGISEKKVENDKITVHPNPVVENQLKVAIDVENTKIFKAELLDISGKLLFAKNFQPIINRETLLLNLDAGLSNGLYFLRLSGENMSISKKVILNR